MNNESIKEILEDVKRHLDYVDATKQCSIRDNEMRIMYDYITNLQTIEKEYSAVLSENAELEQKINQYENPDDLTLFYMWSDGKVKNKMKQLQEEIHKKEAMYDSLAVDYRLSQEENERLKERCDYLQRSCDRKEEQRDDARREYMEQEDYKSRNKKGIAICDEMLKVLYDYTDRKVFEDIKDALTVGDTSVKD